MENEKKPSEEYLKALKALKKIDTNKDKYKIIENPEAYFAPFLKDFTDLPSINIIQLDVYKVLKDVASRSDKEGTKDTAYFLTRYTLDQYANILRGFYNYAINLIQTLIDNSSDSLLDAYNQKFIDKKSLEICMKKMTTVIPILEKDKEEVKMCLVEMEDMIRNLSNY